MAVVLVQLEQRLSAVETALTQVQQRLGLTPPPLNRVDQIAESLADIPEEDYQQFLACCQAVRDGGAISGAEDPRP
jgi:hypothetical protein